MCSVSLLPKELRAAQERPRPQLPADHVGPFTQEEHGESLEAVVEEWQPLHWLIFKGRSLYELIHFPNMFQMTVSDVGRTISGSCTSM